MSHQLDRWGHQERDFHAATNDSDWHRPDERVKSGREHRVPLSTRALEVLVEAQ